MRVGFDAILLTAAACTPSGSCAPADYGCNLRLYRQEARFRPPDFSRAPQLARNEYLDRNLKNVARERDDYMAIALLRVLAAYPPETRQKFCSDIVIRGALRRRGAHIQNPPIFGEYTEILQQQVGCPF